MASSSNSGHGISKPQPQNRACDRCKRRKQRCNFTSSSSICANCQDAGEHCVFNVPLGRRGPKSRRSRPTLDVPSPNTASAGVDPLPLDASTPRSSVSRFSDLATPTEPSAFGLTSPTVSSASLHWQHQHQQQQCQAATSPSAVSPQAALHLAAVLQRWADLSAAIRARVPTTSLETISRRCFDLFFEYLFPLTPLADEPTLREALEFFIAGAVPPAQGDISSSMDLDHDHHQPPPQQQASSLSHVSPRLNVRSRPWLNPDQRILNPTTTDTSNPVTNLIRFPELWLESTFTWITAVCAEVAFFLPGDIFPEGSLIAETFLQASRDCLGSYFESDLEQPSASSVAIRYFHSNCVHAVGKQRYSWHIFGEATRLAQVMNLHDEASYEGLAPVEAELRRRAFWLVYVGDKSAALLNNRPIAMHKYSFEMGITTKYPSGSGSGSSFVTGFNANLRLWQTASDVFLEMRLIQDRSTSNNNITLDQESVTASPQQAQPRHVILTPQDRARLDNLHVIFATCLDDLPPHLLPDSLRPYEPDVNNRPRSSGGTGSPTTACHSQRHHNHNNHNQNKHQTQSLIQIANLQVSYYCLRMITIQRFEDLGYFAPSPCQSSTAVGDPGAAAPGPAGVDLLLLRKTEIARDLLRIIREAPFWSLQVNGEPNVEKIRLVGASLLAIIHLNEASPVAARARRDFGVLLDVLTRLDSKASDALREGSSWIS